MALFRKGKTQAKEVSLRFTLDCSIPAEDDIFVVRDLEKFLRERTKVEGKKGNLGDRVTLTSDSAHLTVSSKVPFSKRSIKYLVKKFLRKMKIGEYLRVIATNKSSYQVRYIKTHAEEEEED